MIVPDWSFRGLGHLWYQIFCHASTLYVILEFYANFQLPGMIKSALRIQLHVEEVGGS